VATGGVRHVLQVKPGRTLRPLGLSWSGWKITVSCGTLPSLELTSRMTCSRKSSQFGQISVLPGLRGEGVTGCEKIELAFIQRVPPFPRGDYRGVAGRLFQALIQQWIPPPSSPPFSKGGQPKVAVLIIDKHIFSHLQGEGLGSKHLPWAVRSLATSRGGAPQCLGFSKLLNGCLPRGTNILGGQLKHSKASLSLTTSNFSLKS